MKKLRKKFVDLKVYRNSRNGQAIVLLPARKMKPLPKRVRVQW